MLKDALYLASLFFGLGLVVALMAAVHDAVEGWLDRRLAAREGRSRAPWPALRERGLGRTTPRSRGRGQTPRSVVGSGEGARPQPQMAAQSVGRAPAQERWMANAARDVAQKLH